MTQIMTRTPITSIQLAISTPTIVDFRLSHSMTFLLQAPSDAQECRIMGSSSSSLSMIISASPRRRSFSPFCLSARDFVRSRQGFRDCYSKSRIRRDPSAKVHARRVIDGLDAELRSPDGLQYAWRRYRYDDRALIAPSPYFWRQLVGDVPGEDNRALGLIGKHAVFLDNRDERPGHTLAELERAPDLAHIINDCLVESDIIHQSRRSRWRANADDASAFFLNIADH